MMDKEKLYYQLVDHSFGTSAFLFFNENDTKYFYTNKLPDNYKYAYISEIGSFYNTIENMLNFLNGKLDKIEYIKKWKSR